LEIFVIAGAQDAFPLPGGVQASLFLLVANPVFVPRFGSHFFLASFRASPFTFASSVFAPTLLRMLQRYIAIITQRGVLVSMKQCQAGKGALLMLIG
jgi:hypothetical protein